MPKAPSKPKSDKVNIHIRLTRAMLEDLKRESIRTSHNRTTLLRIAWREYMDRLAAEPKKPRR